MPAKPKHVTTSGYSGPERRKPRTKLEAFPLKDREREDVIRHDTRDAEDYEHLVMTVRDRKLHPAGKGFIVVHGRFFTKFGETKVPSETPKVKWFEFREQALAYHKKLLGRINPRKKKRK